MRTVTRGACLAAVLLVFLTSDPHGEQAGKPGPADANRFLIQVHGLYGYIDRAGRIVIPPKYTVASDFLEGRAFFGRDWQRYGYLDSTGRERIPMRFLTGQPFSEGLALVEEQQAITGGGSRRGVGFIRPSGQWAIPPNPSRFTWADDFHEGLALARSEHTGNKLGFINKRGQWAIVPQFDFAEPFSEGVAAADRAGRRGFVDRTGRFVIPPTFAEVHSFSEGLALVYEESCKPLFIDHAGKVAISAPGDFATAFHDVLSIVEVNGRCGLGGTYGYMGRSGAFTIAPAYESAGPFSEGLAAVRRDGKWGFIDRRGNLVISPRFEDTRGGPPGAFRSGLARVYSRIPGYTEANASPMAGLQFGYINTSGDYVWPPTH